MGSVLVSCCSAIREVVFPASMTSGRRPTSSRAEVRSPFGIGARPAVFNVEVAAFHPAELLQRLTERLHSQLTFGIALSQSDEYADASQSAALLRPRRQRPRRRRAAEKRDALSPISLIALHPTPNPLAP